MITIAAIVIAALLVLLLPRTFRIVQQGSVGVVKRLGRFQSIRPSGVTLLIPFVDNITTVDVRETPRTGDRQEVITKRRPTSANSSLTSLLTVAGVSVRPGAEAANRLAQIWSVLPTVYYTN